MAEQALSMAREHAPWRPGTPWWVTGLQGVVLVVIGLYLLLFQASAGRLIVFVIGLVVLIQSLMHIVAGLSGRERSADPYIMLQSGVGATIGLLLTFRDVLVPTLDARSAVTILGLGLLAYALVGLGRIAFARDEARSWFGPVINCLLLLALAIILLTSSDSNAADRLALLGWIALIGGVLLLGLAWYARSRQQSPPLPA